jgi:hypothetical protein
MPVLTPAPSWGGTISRDITLLLCCGAMYHKPGRQLRFDVDQTTTKSSVSIRRKGTCLLPTG